MKAGEFPREDTDKKSYEFIYSLICHDKPLVDSNVFEEAYKLNQPLWAAIVKKPEYEDHPDMPKNADGTPMFSPITDIPTISYFEVIDSPNCVITAFKRCER